MNRQHSVWDDPKVAQGKPRVVEAFGDARVHRTGRPMRTMGNLSEVMDRSVVKRIPEVLTREPSRAMELPDEHCHAIPVLTSYRDVARGDPRTVTPYSPQALKTSNQSIWDYTSRSKRQGSTIQ